LNRNKEDHEKYDPRFHGIYVLIYVLIYVFKYVVMKILPGELLDGDKESSG